MRMHILERLALGAAAATVLAILPPSSEAEVLLRDFFTDDTAGAVPNGAEVGSASYGGGANVTYTVADVGGNLKLRVNSPGPANDTANGSLIDYLPTTQPDVAQVSYEFLVAREGLSQEGLNAFGQELVFDPLGLNLVLFWSSDADGHHLWYGVSIPGQGTFTLTDTGFVYSLETPYAVKWLINTNNDRFSLSVDGTSLATDVAFGADGDSLRELAFVNDFATVGTQQIDNVLIETAPLPSTLALLGIGLAGLGFSRRKQ